MAIGISVGAALVLSYLLGSVPFALLAGRVKGVDLRQHGSGNLGATNAIRVLGKPLGLMVFSLDFLKGFIPVVLVRILPQEWFSGTDIEFLAFASGMSAVVGHIFPLYLKFKGGKGVATSAGALLAVRWDAALVSFIIFFLVRWWTGYVSLSSMALASAFPVLIVFFHPDRAFTAFLWVTLGTSVLALLIILRHKSNLVRIVKGEEPKVGRSAKIRGNNHV